MSTNNNDTNTTNIQTPVVVKNNNKNINNNNINDNQYNMVTNSGTKFVLRTIDENNPSLGPNTRSYINELEQKIKD